MHATPKMSGPLQAILETELACGNTIAEVSAWPPKCSLFVLLRKRFSGGHPVHPDVAYAEMNDSHYWKAEYRYKGGAEALACGFEQ